MHSVDITPEMKESVMEEQVMFSKKRGGLAKENIEKGFGGIWIADKQEYAKFVSAVNNYVFEEDGEGIAFCFATSCATSGNKTLVSWNISEEKLAFSAPFLLLKLQATAFLLTWSESYILALILQSYSSQSCSLAERYASDCITKLKNHQIIYLKFHPAI